jgi:hypothetical protein
MDVIIQTNIDKYSVFGVNYFLSKYGFFPENVEEKLHLIIIRNNDNTQPDGQIKGWVEFEGIRLPVLLPPSRISDQGAPLLTYTNGEVEYPCAIITDSNIIISLDVFRHLGFFLSGHLEKTWALIQEEKKDIIEVPFVDYYCDFLLSCLQIIHNKQNIPIIHKAFWPDGKSCAVCLTHDVDEVKKTYQWITYPLKLILKGNFGIIIPQYRSFIQKLRGHEPYWTFDEIIQMEGSRGVRSSFYFLKETGKILLFDRKTWHHYGRRYDFNDKPIRKLLQDLYSREWEIGLHGSFYSYLDPEKLHIEKEALELSLGMSVTGSRQHNLNLKIPNTWLYQESAGLFYDTTLGYNDCLGFRWGISFPFRPFYAKDNRSINILQIPLAIEDLPYFRCQHPWNEFLIIFNHIKVTHGVLTLLWHQTVFNENEYPGWAREYEQIIDYCKNHNAWIGSTKQIYEWWTRREKTTIDWNFDGTFLKISPVPKEQEHFIKIYLPDSLKIKEVHNATIIRCDQKECEIKTDILQKEEVIEITFSRV